MFKTIYNAKFQVVTAAASISSASIIIDKRFKSDVINLNSNSTSDRSLLGVVQIEENLSTIISSYGWLSVVENPFSYNTNIPTDEEVDIAATVIRRKGFSHFFKSNAVVTSEAFHDMIKDAKQLIAQKKENTQNKPIVNINSTAQSISTENKWNELKNRYRCSICQTGPFAAPCITSCSHSFCGECLYENQQSCNSNDIDVLVSCPSCRSEIMSSTFEIVLDATICHEVEEFLSTEPTLPAVVKQGIDEWKSRRDAYFNRKIRESALRNCSNDNDNEDDIQSIYHDYVIFLAAIIIIIAFAIRP